MRNTRVFMLETEEKPMPDLEADLFQLAMSKEAEPLMDAVKKHIADNVEPIQEEFSALEKEKED